MKTKPALEIAIATDSNYLIPTTVLLKSLFENNQDILVTVNLLYLFSATKEQDVDFLYNYVVEHGHLCRKVGISDEQLGVVPECRHSKSTFLRLLLPEILSEIPYILYLDGDIIIPGSISYFCSLDMSNYYIAGVKESTNFHMKEYCQKLGLTDDAFYFNAGVVFMNLDLMRKEQMTAQFFDYLKTNADILIDNDQGILNGVLWRKVKYMPPKYNRNYMLEPDVTRALYTKAELNEAKRQPAIIHYIGPIKPWNYLSYHPKTKLWWKYLKMTPFKDFQPKNKPLSNIPKKYCLKLVKTIDSSVTVSFKRKVGKLLPRGLKLMLKKWKQ
ncbi:MAG: glycosyltransferase family 8 protein [Bacteroidetes bacterium]|nr:glycosyltransferase family 8 protein [Bacteroidota bacterium]MCL2303283.1 glycosyltransferase family 8 protein [Lentimicrobiaceae bacterium]